MKIKLILVGILFMAGTLYAESRPRIAGVTRPQAGQYTSGAVYYSSSTCQDMGPTNVVISTMPGSLFAINVTSAAPNSGHFFSVHDTNIDTEAVTSRVISHQVQTNAVGQWVYNVGFSSGLAVDNFGINPACIDILYFLE